MKKYIVCLPLIFVITACSPLEAMEEKPRPPAVGFDELEESESNPASHPANTFVGPPPGGASSQPSVSPEAPPIDTYTPPVGAPYQEGAGGQTGRTEGGVGVPPAPNSDIPDAPTYIEDGTAYYLNDLQF